MDLTQRWSLLGSRMFRRRDTAYVYGNHLRRYRRDCIAARVALTCTTGIMLTPFYLAAEGIMPWMSAVGILIVCLGIFFVSWINDSLAPWWAYWGGPTLDTKIRSEEMQQWMLDTGMLDRVYLPPDHPGILHFRRASDATLFKLTWGGNI